MADYGGTEQNLRLAQQMLKQQGEINALRAERDALKAAIEQVRKLHRPMAVYSGDAGCLEEAECAEEQDYPEGEESAIGGFCPHTIKDATICPACSRMDFETDSWPQNHWVLYPCPTIAALDAPETAESGKSFSQISIEAMVAKSQANAAAAPETPGDAETEHGDG